MKKAFRILISIILFLPSIPFLYLVYSTFGLFFIIPIYGLFSFPFYWLLDNKEGIEESKDSLELGLELIRIPFLFWYYFIIGKNPLKELH